jgi:hypothetical protein
MNLRPAGEDLVAVMAMAAIVFVTMMVYGEYTDSTISQRHVAQVSAPAG